MERTISLVIHHQYWRIPSQSGGFPQETPIHERKPIMVKSLSNSLIARGVIALCIGAVALAWPGITVFALVVVFAVYAFIGAGLEAQQAFITRTGGSVVGHLLL